MIVQPESSFAILSISPVKDLVIVREVLDSCISVNGALATL